MGDNAKLMQNPLLLPARKPPDRNPESVQVIKASPTVCLVETAVSYRPPTVSSGNCIGPEGYSGLSCGIFVIK